MYWIDIPRVQCNWAAGAEGSEIGRDPGSLAEARLVAVVLPARIHCEVAMRPSLSRAPPHDAAMRPYPEESMIWIVTVILMVQVLHKLRLACVGPADMVSAASDSANVTLNHRMRAACFFVLDVAEVKGTGSKTWNGFY